jgi:hypothetical protein
MCGHFFDVPESFLDELAPSPRKGDENHHPELAFGSVDHVASWEGPASSVGPAVIFVLETTASAIQSGFYKSALHAIRQLLDFDASELLLRRRVSLMLFDSSFSCFAPLKSGRFRKITVRSPGEPFVPASPTSLFVDVSNDEARNDFRDLLEQLLEEVQPLEELPRSAAAGDAMRAAIEALSAVGGGDVVIFHASSPSTGMGTPVQPKALEKPANVPQQHQFYKETLALCMSGGVAINTVVAPGANVELDVETLQWLTWQTGGDALHLPSFSVAASPQLTQHLLHWVGRVQGSAYDCVVKLRCSKGLKCSELLAPWAAAQSSENSAFEIPRISPDATFTFSLALDDVDDEDYLYRLKYQYVQLAVLYTNWKGERFLRIHNSAIAVTNSIHTVYQNASVGPLISLFMRRAANGALRSRNVEAGTRPQRDDLLEGLLKILKHYQGNCNRSNVGDYAVAITKRLNLLPLYVLGARKLIYSTEGMNSSKSELLQRLLRMPIHSLLATLYPRVYPVVVDDDDSTNEGDITCSTIAPSNVPPPMAPIQETMSKGAWPACLVVTGLGAWMFLNNSSAAPKEKLLNEEPALLQAAAARICMQVRELLEPTPTCLLMDQIKVRSAAEISRSQKLFIASLFVEDEGLAELGYPEWIAFLQEQLQIRRRQEQRS